MNVVKPVSKILYAFLFLAFLLLGTWIPLPSDVFAASCYGSSCHGYNPQTMGCSSDAVTVIAGDYSGALVEGRWSSTCNAEWTRTKNISGRYKYAAASSRYGCANYCYHFSVSSPAKIAHGAKVYTHMVGPADSTPTLSCGRVSDYGPISTPLSYYCVGQH